MDRMNLSSLHLSHAVCLTLIALCGTFQDSMPFKCSWSMCGIVAAGFIAVLGALVA